MKFNLFISAALIWKNGGKQLFRITDKQGNVNLKVKESLFSRLRNLLLNLSASQMNLMSCSNVVPPAHVQGMTTLDRKAFSTKVKVPGVKVPKLEISANQKVWKSCVFKMRGLKPIAELGDNDPLRETHNLILIDPEKLVVDKLNQQQKEFFERYGLDTLSPTLFDIDLHYDNWSASDIFRAVLPSDAENVTSFSQIGHIAHLNLKPESLPYKTLIGEVLIDKISAVKTVVNKLNAIDNTYRNFQMELLAGENNFVTKTKEHNCTFELDFSKVYWNSRLSTEHQRVIEYIPAYSEIYDVFAGIGPFSVPLAKRKHCLVWANDLNPHSYQYLNTNFELNKVKLSNVKTYNMDGRDFIKTVLKPRLVERIKTLSGHCCIESESFEKEKSNNKESELYETASKSFVIMNLPAIAVEFLSEFNSLLHDLPEDLRSAQVLDKVLPEVLCYAFTPKTDPEEELKPRVQQCLSHPMPSNYSCRIVRNVAPNKEMVCLSFKLWPDLVLGKTEQMNNCVNKETLSTVRKCESEPEPKRIKCDV